MNAWQEALLLAVYPELREYPPHERREALQRARAGAFDTLEWVGLVLIVGVVALVTRYSIHGLTGIQLLGVAVTEFFIALILLAVAGGPILWRRTRRHLGYGLRDSGARTG